MGFNSGFKGLSSSFILSTSLLIMFDTLLLRPSLHCNTPPHFTTLPHTLLHFATLHPTTLHYIYRHFTSSRLHFITLSFSFTQLRNYISGVLYWTGCVMAERQSLVLVLQWWSWHNGSCFEILRDYPSQSSLHDCPTPIQQRSLQFQMTLTYSVLVTP